MQAVIKPLNGEMVMVLNEDILKTLGLAVGDTVNIDVDENGVVRLDDADGQRAARLERGRAFMHRYRETLDILAK